MSNKNRKPASQPVGKDRRISIRSELRQEPDVHKIARAVIALALAQAEADAARRAAHRDTAVEREELDDAQSSS